MDTKVKKIKILLVDDDEMMRIYFRDIFWIHGGDDKYDISIASSIADAEKKLSDSATRPDTIFLDVMIPIKEGHNSPHEQLERSLEFVKRIRADKELSRIKIIIYSGQKEKTITEEFNKLGIDGYLRKGDLMPKEIIDFTNKIHERNN